MFPSPGEYSELGLSLVLGGGVDVRLWRGLGVGVDVRWLRILRSYDAFDAAQVTSRVSYRFCDSEIAAASCASVGVERGRESASPDKSGRERARSRCLWRPPTERVRA